MASEENGIFGEERSTTSIKEHIAGYLAYWPLFLISTLVCVLAAIFYTRYLPPKYMASVSFLVNGGEGGSSKADIVDYAVSGKGGRNLSNEMLLVGSTSIMQRTVAKYGFNISYLIKGRTLNTDVYKGAPFRLTAVNLTDSNSTYELDIHKFTTAGGTFTYGPEKAEKTYNFEWNKNFVINGQTFVLTPVSNPRNISGDYIAMWQPVPAVAGNFSANLTVKPLDTKTNAIQLSLKTENINKGIDVLNALFTEFNLSDIEDRNKLSENTVRFIDERLLSISRELDSVEGGLEKFQSSHQVINIGSQTGSSLGNADAASKAATELAVQQGVTNMIQDYFANPANDSKLVPSTLGLSDGTLDALVGQYNTLQLKKEKEAPDVAPNSTVMQEINSQLGSIKGSILKNLNNINQNLQLRKGSFQQQQGQYRGFLSQVPHNERVLKAIDRKQTVTEGLYLYLLQKREENAISSTGASVPAYKQIDPATGSGPVEPNSRNIILTAAILGFAIAFGWVYLKEQLLNDKISSKNDILRRVGIPIIGQVSHTPKKSKGVISVLGRNLAGEEFRAIRTNMSFLLKNKKDKVVLITSTLSNEGKSFISLNLAAVCAIPGKKVALLEFDVRRPVIANILGLDTTRGLSEFLAGEVNSLADICYNVDEIPSLHIYPSGSVSLNAADLLLSSHVNTLFEMLKEEYDFIIVDSPPVGLVSDAFLLNPYCEMVLYIIRQNITLKNQLDGINDIRKSGNLKNMQLILNDVRTGKKTYSYYGYDKDNSYSKSKAGKGMKKVFAGLFNF